MFVKISIITLAISMTMVGGIVSAQDILHHDISVRIWPDEKRLEGDCTIIVSPRTDRAGSLFFEMLNGDILSVELDGELVEEYAYLALGEASDQYDICRLVIPIPPSDSMASVVLRIRYVDDHFYGTATNPDDNKPFALGQIDAEAGSFSSHISYYPFIRYAGNSADIRITVPDGQLAVSSGSLVGTSKPEPGWMTYHWHSDRGSGILPYPFAAHTYRTLDAVAADGKTNIEIYYLPEDEEYARQKVAILQDIFAVYLRLFGDYPFSKFALVETALLEGNIGLAAQSVVMLSKNLWFAVDIDTLDLRIANIPLLVLADEMAHQWNAYKVSTPNFLAEGISRYTDSFYMAHRGARQGDNGVLQRHMTHTRASYFRLIEKVPDIAINKSAVTPALYFVKGALALDMLRARLGEETFVAGMRAYFTDNEGEVTGLRTFAAAFEKVSGEELMWHFKQWYERDGHPVLRFDWSAEPGGLNEGFTVNIEIEQTQTGDPYRLRIPVEISAEDGGTQLEVVEITEDQQSFVVTVSFRPSKVVLDPDQLLPVEIVGERSVLPVVRPAGPSGSQH
jgi:aminopeptidase N